LAGLAFVAARRPEFVETGVPAQRVFALAKLTLGVYLVHPLVIFSLRRLFGLLPPEAPYDSWAFLAVLSTLAVTGSFLIAGLLKRWRLTRKFV